MKILFIQPTADKKGHYGKYSVNLCQELARLGNEAVLFTNKVEPEKFIKEAPLFRIVEWKNRTFSFEQFDQKRKSAPWLYFLGYLRNSFVILKAALRFAKKEKFDLIQVTDVEFGVLSLLLMLYGKNLPPVVLLLHAANFSFSKYPGNIIFRMYKVLQREFLRLRLGREIKTIVTLGEYHKEELQKQFRLPNSFSIKVIYDGSEPPVVFFDKMEAREKLGIHYDDVIFLLFGILRRDKGIEYLLEAVRVLDNKKPAVEADSSGSTHSAIFLGLSPASNIANQEKLSKNIEYKILIAGSPFDYEPKEISDMVMRLGLEDKVILRLQYIPDEEIPFYFFSADCAVFPYCKIYTGGTGPLLKEASMHKKPIIASRVSEMGYLVEKRNMGLVAEPENAGSLAQKMSEFLGSSEAQRKEWGENAFAAANTWKTMAQQYLGLYGKIVIPAKN